MDKRTFLRRFAAAVGVFASAVLSRIVASRHDGRSDIDDIATTSVPGALSLESQPETRITLGLEVIVGSSADANDNHEELMLAAHPTRANTLLGSAFIVLKGSTNKKSANAYVSTNRGQVWLKSPDAAFTGDPIVAVTRQGTLFFAGINSASSGGLIYHRSIDDGITWSQAANTTVSVDFPKVAIDYTSGPYSGRVYVTGRAPDNNIYVFRSVDDAATFTSVVAVANAGQAFAYNPIVLRDGTLFVGCQTARRIRSENGVYAGSSADHYAVRSADGGVTFTPSRKIMTDSRIPNVIGGSIPMYAAGVFGGVERIYLLMADTSSSNGRLRLRYSSDMGESWSDPIDVVRNVPPSVAHAQASLMVNQAGVLGICWIQSTAGTQAYDIYFSGSTDGGNSFTTPSRVSTMSSDPPAVSYRYPGGDYMYSTAAADGSFHLFWPDARSGIYQIYTRRVLVNDGPSITPSPLPTATATAAPSPTSPTAEALDLPQVYLPIIEVAPPASEGRYDRPLGDEGRS